MAARHEGLKETGEGGQALDRLCQGCARSCKQDARCVVVQCPKRVPKA